MRRDDAERFIEGVRGDDPEITAKLRIEERELEAGVELPRLDRIGRLDPCGSGEQGDGGRPLAR